MKIAGLICLLLATWWICRAYGNYREERYRQLQEFFRILHKVGEDIAVYHTFRPCKDTEDYPLLRDLGFVGKEDVADDLLGVVPRLYLKGDEKKNICDVLSSLGEGNLQSETNKIEKMIDNVKIILQKEEQDGKKSVDTVRIALFTIALSLVIVLL